MHSCDNPICCNPKHLSKGTHKDNSDDKVRKNRHAFGEKNGRWTTGYYSKYNPVPKPKPLFDKVYGRKLTLEQVIYIKEQIQTQELAKE